MLVTSSFLLHKTDARAVIVLATDVSATEARAGTGHNVPLVREGPTACHLVRTPQ